ncbi:MAG: formate dehydrogenase accessory sulfurtransferase FdhD [Candidatus Bathyarchaeia archaeon]
METSVKYTISKFARGRINNVEDEVAVESPIVIYVNRKRLRVLYATPQELKELAIGHLITEGFIESLEEVIGTYVKDGEVYVDASVAVEERIKLYNAKVVNTIKTICGQSSETLIESLSVQRVQSSVKWALSEIFKLVRKLNSDAALYRRTGGVHAALIADTKGVAILCEDVGRHNAVDKAIGAYILRESAYFNHTLLVCSGRLSSEIVLKVARVGIPILVSISAPTSLGVSLAAQLGVTLIGFVRGFRCNVYTYPERLMFT